MIQMIEQRSFLNIISLLQKTRQKKKLKCAKNVHEQLCNTGLENDGNLGNYVVPLFVECGSISDGQQAFNGLLHLNEHSWTSLILGYIEIGQPDHALKVYKRMQRDSIEPSCYTLIALLQACARLKDIERGRWFHIHISKIKLGKDILVINALMDMYIKCSCLTEARDAFNQLSVRDVLSYNTLIAEYVENGCGCEAMRCYQQMQDECLSPSALTFVYILKACSRFTAIARGRGVHADILQMGFEKDIYIGNSLVDMYAKCSSFREAHEVFDKLLFQSVVSWTAIIGGYANRQCDQEVLHCFEQMKQNGISPDVVTFICCLKACGSSRTINQGRRIHADIVQKGFERQLSTCNALVDMYSKCGSLLEAQEVFDKLPVRDVVSWTALMSGYAENGFNLEALRCFDYMGVEGISPNAVTYGCILKCCSNIEAICKGREIHVEILQRGHGDDCSLSNSLLGMYAKCGSLPEAWEIFDKLPVRDAVSWTQIMVGFAEGEFGHKAMKLFEEMHLENVSSDDVTLAASLNLCRSIGAIEKGREIHCHLIQQGLESDLSLGNSLIGMYADCGSLIEAFVVFDSLPVRDSMLWNAIIAQYVEHEYAHEVLRCFGQKQLEGVSLDAATFIWALRACTIIGAIELGREIHCQLAVAGFDEILLGNVLVDMYVKCGSLVEASNVFDKLPVRDVVSWSAIISGYTVHGFGDDTLNCFAQMQLEGLSLDAIAFTSSLRACSKIGAIEKGHEIHAEVLEKGLEIEVSVANALIDFYAKSGSFDKMQKVFDKIPVQGVVSWNTLIAGYAKNGLGLNALTCFRQMQLQDVSPNSATFFSVLIASGSIGAVDKVCEIHAQINREGLGQNPHLGNSLITTYARCGSLIGARQVFDELLVRDSQHWTAMIAAYAEHGSGHEVLKCFEEMLLSGLHPDANTFVCSLKACNSMGAIDRGREIHSELVNCGFKADLFVCNTLIDMYAKCGSLAEAQDAFDRLALPNVVSWTTLISGYIEHELPLEALKCFEKMQMLGISPNEVTFVCGLKACGSIGFLEKGREIHHDLSKVGLERNLAVGNTLISMYSKCGSVKDAQEVFDRMLVRDAVSWTTIITGYVGQGFGKEALRWFKQMQLDGFFPNTLTLVCSLKACSSIGALERGREIHTEIIQKGSGRDLSVANTLIDMYIKCGSFSEAEKIFDRLPVQDIVSWNAIISGYAENGCGGEAFMCSEHMLQEGIPPDATTFSCMLKACNNVELLDKMREIHLQVINRGFENDAFVSTSLVDMYAKHGWLSEARDVFDRMLKRDIASWNVMIRGFGLNNECKEAVECFEDMLEQGIKPDSITYVCLLIACSRAGLVMKGLEYFKMMASDHTIYPTVDHYTCMVDLLARSGHLFEAVKLAKIFLDPSSKEAWITLLSCCQTYAETGLGLTCFQKRTQIDPEDATSYVFMANIYANMDPRITLKVAEKSNKKVNQ